MSTDDLAARLLAIFLEELDDQLAIMEADLRELEARRDDANRIRSVFRVLHTVKGAARVAGVPAIELASHGLEALLHGIRDGSQRLDVDTIRCLRDAASAFADAGQRIRVGRELTDSPIAALLAELGAEPPADALRAPAGAVPTGVTGETTGREGGGGVATGAGEAAEGPIRVRAEELDALLASASDLLITSGRVGQRPRALDALHERLTGMAAECRRSAAALRLVLDRADAPPGLAALVRRIEDELRTTAREVRGLAEEVNVDARALQRITDEVADTVHRLRLRPFGAACRALPGAVRDVAAVSGRAVDLEVHGEDTRVDRAVVDALREPLLHLVRNAVDHGIEPPAERVRAGKPERGTVRVEAALANGRLTVRVSDDGAGLDIEAIRARLEERGVKIAPGERQLVHALFAGGLSTREEPTAISGRGVGLDVVRATLERIGGSVDAFWTAGQGTTFVLECPPTPARIRALLVTVGAQLFAIPTGHVDRLRRVEAERIRSVEGRPVLAGDGADDEPIAFGALAGILGPPLAPRPLAGTVPVVILRAGANRLAVAVDELIAEQELVFRPLERGRITLPHISGGALLPSGQAALVLNPVGVVAAGIGRREPVELAVESARTGASEPRRVLVVDDSITTRTLEQSILEAAGYDVLTAVDGEDAWQTLQEQRVDLVVADVEMPRLDGFGLCEAIRASKRMRELPVVLVTALETPEHRERGLEVGADAYLAKSSFDQETLLDTIRQLLG